MFTRYIVYKKLRVKYPDAQTLPYIYTLFLGRNWLLSLLY